MQFQGTNEQYTHGDSDITRILDVDYHVYHKEIEFHRQIVDSHVKEIPRSFNFDKSCNKFNIWLTSIKSELKMIFLKVNVNWYIKNVKSHI